jgi:hypothetical protein
MTVANFDKLSNRDFENGAVLDEIRAALVEREELLTGQNAEVAPACISYPAEPTGHHGTFAYGVVCCSYCKHTTRTDATPPFTIHCPGCRRLVRIEARAEAPT